MEVNIPMGGCSMKKSKTIAKKVSAVSDSNLFGAGAYLLGIITGIVLYLVKPKDKYVKYHAIQSILLTIVVWLAMVIVGTIVGVLAFTNTTLWAGIGISLMALINLTAVILWLYCMWKAHSGEKFKLFVIGDIAAKHVG